MAKDTEPFRKVSPRIWRSKRFKKLSDDARIAHLYFLTCHTELFGVGIVPPAYGGADLGWTEDRFGKARDEIEAAGLIIIDHESDEYYAPGWFVFNKPSNPSTRLGWMKSLERVESETVRSVAMRELGSTTPDEPDQRPRKAAPKARTSRNTDDDWDL